MPHPRRTKIIATLGPATDEPGRLEELLAAGVDVCRLNFSHGRADEHRRRVERVRAAEAALGRPIGLLQDLQGPKIRCATFAAGAVELRTGATFRLTRDDSPGDETRVGTTLPALIDELGPGQRLLLNDGLIALEVVERRPDELICRVTEGGRLSDHKGINVPDADLSVPALAAKDLADLALGRELGVEWVALSFVRTAADLRQARAELARLGSSARLMAKIEKPGAVDRFADLLAEADGVMIARGDLGVELPPERVPVIQRALIRACLAAAKPVVVATQMLESMIHEPRPTRAEASDVATAIFDGADAVMLSGETAVGAHPLEAVRMMARIASETETSADFRAGLYRYWEEDEPSIEVAVCHSACRLAEIVPAEVIASYTWSGTTVHRIARHRPAARVVGLTPSPTVARQLALTWGVEPLVTEDPAQSDAMTSQAIARLLAAGVIVEGEEVVVTAGLPFGRPGTTNTVRVQRVSAADRRPPDAARTAS